MSYSKLTLSYRNEDDKAFGLAGMIFSLSAMNALNLVSEVTLDTDGPMVTFTSSYYHPGSGAVSPKGVWEALRRNFYLTSSMVVGNVMSRAMVRDGVDVPDELLRTIRRHMAEEGKETCGLDADETDMIYDHLLRQNMQIFYNTRLHPAVRRLSQAFGLQRSMSIGDIVSELEEM